MKPQMDMNMGQSCGCGTQPMMMPDMNMGQSCGCHQQPMMMPTWQMDPCHCPPPPCPTHCPPPCPPAGDNGCHRTISQAG